MPEMPEVEIIRRYLDKNLVGKKIEVSGGSRALARQIRSGDIHVLDEENERARKNGSRKNTERVE